MDTFTVAVVASLLAAGIAGLARIALKRHFLLIALSREVEWQRERLSHFQQIIREVAETRGFEGPMVLRGYKRSSNSRFSTLLHQALHYAPSVHAKLAVFDDRVNEIESHFEDFAQQLSIDPDGEAEIAALSRSLATLGHRIFTACDIVLTETARRELVAFPIRYPFEHAVIKLDRHVALARTSIRLLGAPHEGKQVSVRPSEAIIDVPFQVEDTQKRPSSTR